MPLCPVGVLALIVLTAIPLAERLQHRRRGNDRLPGERDEEKAPGVEAEALSAEDSKSQSATSMHC